MDLDALRQEHADRCQTLDMQYRETEKMLDDVNIPPCIAKLARFGLLVERGDKMRRERDRLVRSAGKLVLGC